MQRAHFPIYKKRAQTHDFCHPSINIRNAGFATATSTYLTAVLKGSVLHLLVGTSRS